MLQPSLHFSLGFNHNSSMQATLVICSVWLSCRTTHEFLFGALAEIVDNARDAKATKISIYTGIS